MVGYLPQKNMVPKEYSGAVEGWRAWKEESEDYFDTVRPGLKKIMKEAEKLVSIMGPVCPVEHGSKFQPRAPWQTGHP